MSSPAAVYLRGTDTRFSLDKTRPAIHPFPSTEAQGWCPPPSPTYSLDWTANSGVWDSRNLKVRDLSHSKLKIPTSWM